MEKTLSRCVSKSKLLHNECLCCLCQRMDQYSQSKILQNGRLDAIENLEEQFNENIYLSA